MTSSQPPGLTSLALDGRRVPYGHPDSVVEMPDGAYLVWKDMTALEHRWVAAWDRWQGGQAQYRMKMYALEIEVRQERASAPSDG